MQPPPGEKCYLGSVERELEELSKETTEPSPCPSLSLTLSLREKQHNFLQTRQMLLSTGCIVFSLTALRVKLFAKNRFYIPPRKDMTAIKGA